MGLGWPPPEGVRGMGWGWRDARVFKGLRLLGGPFWPGPGDGEGLGRRDILIDVLNDNKRRLVDGLLYTYTKRGAWPKREGRSAVIVVDDCAAFLLGKRGKTSGPASLLVDGRLGKGVGGAATTLSARWAEDATGR
jgi:hypothetical protein